MIAISMSGPAWYCAVRFNMSRKQVSYGINLASDLGTALYSPVRCRQYSGRVGDIAFLHEDGRYEWIRNAFDADVLREPPSSLT